MRVVWQNNRFEAELTPGELWSNDKDSVQAAGFKTDGPPNWTWHTTKASVLNKLRKNRPKSDLTLTELAFQNYQSLNKKDEEKAALKKQFEQSRKDSEKELDSEDRNEYYLDEELGIRCVVVRPASKLPYTKYNPPEPPAERCLICDDPLYAYEAKNICLWCEITLDKEKKV